MFDKLKEECGIFGVFGADKSVYDPASLAYYALFALQHRGQETAGIAVNDDGLITCYKDSGLVKDIFSKDILDSLSGADAAIGHVRYGSAPGADERVNAQPLVVNHVKGRMALAYNGNINNAFELREELELSGAIFHTTSDTEVISYMITKERLTAPSIEVAISRAMNSLKGAYCLVVMSPSKLIAARDPYGFHPLCIGKLGDGYIFASETCALDSIGATFVRDVEPGEIVVADKDGLRSLTEHVGKQKRGLCVFEYIYFARPDSVVDGASVHKARVNAGKFLAKSHPVEADVVVGVPDSGLDAAIGFSNQSGIPYGIGFIKNKYIGRTFIEPGQAHRKDIVQIKLNVVQETVKGKRVVLVDDSIVRGTTSARIVSLLRDAGAKEVHMRVSAPPFLYPCYFGTDIDSRDKLIANNHTIEEITDIIGVDSLGYLGIDEVEEIADGCPKGFCIGCFTGEYPSEIPQSIKVDKFQYKKSEKSQLTIENESASV